MAAVQLVALRGGRYEIVRVRPARSSLPPNDPLAYEKSIVWLEDFRSLRYVRTVQVRCAKSRRGPLRLNTGERVVGYSKLLAEAPRDPRTDRYTRRLFYLKPCDIVTGAAREIAVPPNAVDPRTVLPGVSGGRPVDV